MRNLLLRDSDAMSMAHSLELRVPLLDDDLVSYVLGLPLRVKLAGRGVKPLLALAVADLVPEPVVRRRKQGFILPMQSWMRGAMAQQVEQVFLDPERGGPLRDILDPQAVAEVWERFRSGSGYWTRPWSLYVLKTWAESHFAGY